ncbi:MAG: hypothetical protein Greene041662_901 [Candidatus Peregrinibacteria bacterium Greene0416_62]|nr:MAG: hypothetical protein Greene041662_901 [Candidatus Peregrinibacteria bacterium Greene0416_62]TSC99878.1 MAG: hypothetical protein Greene101449_471 [Candidatus Peregrinibacteria bacterium Greene1014_49]
MRFMDSLSALRRIPLRPLVWGFFAVTLALGLWVAKDYGISWDEKAMFVLGEESYEYVVLGEEYPTHIGIRYHGSFLEIFLYAAEELFHLRYARHVFIFRHAVTFLLYWGGMIAVYALALRQFKHRGWALLAALIYFLSPRQFGHAFVNSRDIPAMVFFTVKMLTLLYFLDHKTIRSAVLHGMICGMVVALRIGGLFAPIFTVIFFLVEILREHLKGERILWKRYALLLTLYAGVFIFSTIAFWPLLWDKPFVNFYEAVHNMMTSQQSPGGLYFGTSIGQTPWHWIFVHFITKTPPLYVGLFFAGVTAFMIDAFRHPRALLFERRDLLLFFSWFAIPISIVIVLEADLFDEWRHLYFIYPAVVLIAVHGLRELMRMTKCVNRLRLRQAFLATLIAVPAAGFVSVAVWMVRFHPLEYVYFSLPSKYVEFNFELDYWGLSYRQGFEWILENDPDEFVTVTVTSSPGWENLNILTREQRRRLVLSKKYTSKYVLDNFDWQEYRHTLPEDTIVHSVKVSGMPVLNVYRNPFWTYEKIDPEDIMENEKVQMWFDPKSML